MIANRGLQLHLSAFRPSDKKMSSNSFEFIYLKHGSIAVTEPGGERGEGVGTGGEHVCAFCHIFKSPAAQATEELPAAKPGVQRRLAKLKETPKQILDENTKGMQEMEEGVGFEPDELEIDEDGLFEGEKTTSIRDVYGLPPPLQPPRPSLHHPQQIGVGAGTTKLPILTPRPASALMANLHLQQQHHHHHQQQQLLALYPSRKRTADDALLPTPVTKPLTLSEEQGFYYREVETPQQQKRERSPRESLKLTPPRLTTASFSPPTSSGPPRPPPLGTKGIVKMNFTIKANDIYEMKIEPGKSRLLGQYPVHILMFKMFSYFRCLADVVLAKNGGEETRFNSKTSREMEEEEEEASLSEPFRKRRRAPVTKEVQERADATRVKQEAPDAEGGDDESLSSPRPHLTLPAPPTKPTGGKMVFLQPRSRPTAEATGAK